MAGEALKRFSLMKVYQKMSFAERCQLQSWEVGMSEQGVGVGAGAKARSGHTF